MIQFSFGSESIHIHEDGLEFGTRAYAACPKGDEFHAMERRGVSTVSVDGKDIWRTGAVYQCERCNEAIFS